MKQKKRETYRDEIIDFPFLMLFGFTILFAFFKFQYAFNIFIILSFLRYIMLNGDIYN